MMKSHFLVAAALLLPAITPDPAGAAESPKTFIYESPREFFGSGDFDGDGRFDLVIVDKESGKYRLGYQSADGTFAWVDCRPTGLKAISGFSIGKVLATNLDGLAFTSADGNQIILAEASSAVAPSRP